MLLIIQGTAIAVQHCQQHQRILVMFRPPSHHTYGFISNSYDVYDMPQIELKSLLCEKSEGTQFIPVHDTSSQRHDGNFKMHRVSLSRNQSKKKKKVTYVHNIIPSMYWIESADGSANENTLSKATSRAILTHATFAIYDSVCNISEDVWNECLSYAHNNSNINLCDGMLKQMNIIDMTNPNMSRNDKNELMQKIVYLIERHQLDLQMHKIKVEGKQPITIHVQQNGYHELYFGYRIAIGLAGTQGVPSQTLRRTHRGILKKFALKNRIVTSDVAHITSTAMEPEIGFLMANLALGMRAKESRALRILDPCCGSGRLLLYAAALLCGDDKQPTLVGVDYDPNVWEDAASEFERFGFTAPTFIHGDVQNSLSTAEVLCTPNSFDAIICDPPYNIGAPALEPGNYHDKDDDRGDKSSTQEVRGIISSIISIAEKVLVVGGRIVFFLPVRGKDKTISPDELLQEDLEKCSRLCLLKGSSRQQTFSPTFSRWLVCIEKR